MGFEVVRDPLLGAFTGGVALLNTRKIKAVYNVDIKGIIY